LALAIVCSSCVVVGYPLGCGSERHHQLLPPPPEPSLELDDDEEDESKEEELESKVTLVRRSTTGRRTVPPQAHAKISSACPSPTNVAGKKTLRRFEKIRLLHCGQRGRDARHANQANRGTPRKGRKQRLKNMAV
jgi:hypothetical protein